MGFNQSDLNQNPLDNLHLHRIRLDLGVRYEEFNWRRFCKNNVWQFLVPH